MLLLLMAKALPRFCLGGNVKDPVHNQGVARTMAEKLLDLRRFTAFSVILARLADPTRVRLLIGTVFFRCPHLLPYDINCSRQQQVSHG